MEVLGTGNLSIIQDSTVFTIQILPNVHHNGKVWKKKSSRFLHIYNLNIINTCIH